MRTSALRLEGVGVVGGEGGGNEGIRCCQTLVFKALRERGLEGGKKSFGE